MRIFALTSVWPRPYHHVRGATATHIVAHSMLDALRASGHEVLLQVVESPPFDDATAEAPDGFESLPPLRLSTPRMSRWERLRAMAGGVVGPGRIEDVYPAAHLSPQVSDRARVWRPDVVLALWSPEGVAASHDVRWVPRVAYHGDVDFVPRSVRLQDRRLFGLETRSLASRLASGVHLWRDRQCHLRLMRRVDLVANVTASNVGYYARRGHRRSVYVPNLWPAPPSGRKAGPPPPREAGPAFRIVGHLGYLDRTGSTYGLDFLAASLPEIAKALGGIDFEIQIIGGGRPFPGIAERLAHPRVRFTGYVEDLDAELAASDVFLLLNNAGRYLAAYTRHVIAWAQRLCLVAHAGSRLAIPEIQDGENALLVSSPSDLGSALRALALRPQLGASLRAGGHATWRRHFTPAIVAGRLLEEIRALPGVGPG